MLDEADEFVKDDTSRGFPMFTALQRLMDETNRRFKFVLAGLHNVTRMVQAENSPLRQIAYDPQRIGPLMGSDLPEAERLIVKPLAALGFTFERREDVWSMLSATNYYPVLAQTLCATLLDDLRDEIRRSKKVDWKIRTDMVRKLLESDKVLPSIKEKFEHTIKELDPRYALLTYVIAACSLRDQQDGRIDEGMTSAAIRDDAIKAWPKAFERLNRLAVIESLLDEMEGLGVLRQVKGDRWALRSPSILALLGTRDRVASELEEFSEREVPKPFEPGAMRRKLLANPRMNIEKDQPSPLTYTQEHNLLTDRRPVTIIFGSPIADIDLVGQAILQAAGDKADRRNVKTDIRAWKSAADIVAAVRAMRDQAEMHYLLVVTNQSEWTGDWVIEVARLKAVKDLKVRVVFVGGPTHAAALVKDKRFRRPDAAIRAVTLETWASSTVDDLASRLELPADRVRPVVLDRLGGYNRNVRRLVQELAQKTNVTRLDKVSETISRSADALAEMGVNPSMEALFARMLEWAEDGLVPYLYVRDGVFKDFENLAERDQEAKSFLRYGELMALLEPGSAGTGEEARTHALNPQLIQCLKVAPTEAA